MPELSFRVEGAEAVPFAAAPLLALKLRVENRIPDQVIHSIVLRVQIQIEATRRQYTAAEQEQMRDLFGEPSRWSTTVRAMLWTHASTVITSFSGSAIAELQVPCTFDFNVAATKYFHGLTGGDIPLDLLFSGSVFYAAPDGILQVAPISWSSEARFRLPLRVWRDMMDHYYPNSAWMCIRKDVFERLLQYKVRRGLQTMEEAIDGLLACAEQAVAS